jgi:sedoheptulokinase
MFLGIDVGTGKTAAAIVGEDGRTVAVSSLPHRAELPAGPGRFEQDPQALLASARAAVRGLPEAARALVKAVGLTGQMHGVLLLDGAGRAVSPLVTWQDGRCLEGGWLEALNTRAGVRLRTGYGCATLAWMAAHGGVPRASAASTVHDWVAAVLCGAARPVTDPTDAASWGLFDLATLSWDRAAAGRAGVPEDLLPAVVPSGALAGCTGTESARLFGIPAGVPVTAALGDNQASLTATLSEPEAELALTLGTGGQLSAVLPRGARLPEAPADASFELRPFTGGRFFAVAASLCGGSAWRWLARGLESWLTEAGLSAPGEDRLFEILNERGAAAERGGLAVLPRFLGERHDPAARGSITGIGLEGFSLGAVARALAEGISENLKGMLPEELRRGRLRVRGSGNALRRNPLLREAAERVFGVPLVMADVREEAAVGAALAAAEAGRKPAGQGGA